MKSETRKTAGRIHAIDAIRGFCLLNIFINHLTVGMLQIVSPSRIAFSDSAEAFVLLAGVSSFLAYGPREGVTFLHTRTTRMWSRARTLFAFYLFLAGASIGIGLFGGVIGEPVDASTHPAALVERHGMATYALHVITLQESVGFSAILRLYVALMLLAPFYVWLAGKRSWYPLVPAAIVWVLAGQFGWAERESLSGNALVLTILPWNLVFAIGISLGAGIVQSIELPKSRMVAVVAAILVLAPLACLTAARYSPDVASWITTRHESFWTGASKPLQSPLRLAHVLALAYLLIVLRKAPLIRLIHEVSPANPLCRLGRRSLQVFTCGAILALAANQLLWTLFSAGVLVQGSAAALASELLLVALACTAMLCVADRRPSGFSFAGQRAFDGLRPT